MTLDQLQPRDRARIVRVLGDDEAADRLMEMGLVEETELEIIKFAPLGDPMEIAVRGYHLTLRKVEAKTVEVEKI